MFVWLSELGASSFVLGFFLFRRSYFALCNLSHPCIFRITISRVHIGLPQNKTIIEFPQTLHSPILFFFDGLPVSVKNFIRLRKV